MFAVRHFQSSYFKGLGKEQWAAPFLKHPVHNIPSAISCQKCNF